MFSNNISRIIKKISNRLGLEIMMDKFPENIDKYKWVEIIQNEVIELYSRYYPHKINYKFNPVSDYNPKNKLYTINKEFISKSDIKILSVKGLGESYKQTGLFPSGLVYDRYNGGDVGCCYDSMSRVDSFINLSQTMTERSYFKDPMIVEFYPPNSFRITNVDYSDLLSNRAPFDIELLVVHPKSLFTLSQTQLTLFEDLCTCKIAEFLYGHLKYYEGIESGYQTIDLKLDTIQDWMNKTEDILNIINESYVSMTNKNESLFYII